MNASSTKTPVQWSMSTCNKRSRRVLATDKTLKIFQSTRSLHLSLHKLLRLIFTFLFNAVRLIVEFSENSMSPLKTYDHPEALHNARETFCAYSARSSTIDNEHDRCHHRIGRKLSCLPLFSLTSSYSKPAYLPS